MSFPFSRTTCAVLFGAILVVWLVNLGTRVLQHPDEGRYAELGREMAVSGDWVTPRLNGLKYFEKPPLQYWLTAASFRAFGVHDWTARLWPALAGLLAIASIAYAGWRLGGAPLALAAGVTLAGTLWHVALAQILTLDALLSALLAVGFTGLVVAQQPEASPRYRRNAMTVAWIALAGAVLAKGLIGLLLPGAALFLYSLAQRDVAIWRRLHLGTGIVLIVVLAAPWFIAVSAANPEFARFFFIHEHFQRFLTTTHHREGSLFYFVPLFAIGMMPWILVVLAGVPAAWRDGAPNRLGFSWQRFALVWAAFVFVFFSVSGSKLPSYILPMFPPLALVAAWLLLRLDPARIARRILPVALAGLCVLVVLLAFYPQLSLRFASARQPVEALAEFRAWMTASVAVCTVGGLAGWLLLRKGEPGRFPGIATLALATLVGTQILVAGLDTFRTTRSGYDIVRAARAAGGVALSDPAIPVFQVRMYDQTLPFYLGRATTLVEHRDEFDLGLSIEPERGIASVDEWTVRWTGAAAAFADVPPDAYTELVRRGLPMRLLARDTRRVVVSRQ